MSPNIEIAHHVKEVTVIAKFILATVTFINRCGINGMTTLQCMVINEGYSFGTYTTLPDA